MDDEAHLICSLPMSRYHRSDTLIWRPTKNGTFFVHNVYHLEMDKQAGRKGEGSNRSGYTPLWKAVRNL
jgi:hypothetical protein